MEVLHVVVADRLQVDENRRRLGELVETFERELEPGAAGDRGEVEDRVGRAGQSEDHPQRVLYGFRRDDAVRRQLRADQGDGAASGFLRAAQPVGMDGRDRRRTGQRQAERLGDAGHGAGGAHHRAGAGGGGEVALDGGDLGGVDLAAAVARPEAPAVGAGAEPLALVAAGHHRPGDELDGRQVGGNRAHQLRRHRLVAAAEQHDAVHRLGADHLLDVHRHQVAELQAGRAEEHLAERDHREFQRQAAGGEHAALHRLEQFGEVAVAVVEAARRVADADDGTHQHLVRIAHGAGEGAAEIEGEVAVAVVGQAAAETDRPAVVVARAHRRAPTSFCLTNFGDR